MTITAETTIDQKAESFNTERVVTIAAAHGSHDTYFSFLPAILPLLIEKLAINKAEAGALTLLYQWPAVLQPLIGHLADKVSLRWLIILAPAISGTMISLVGIAPSYGVTALLLLIAGFSTAGFHAVAPAMVGAYSGKKLGQGMSIFMVGGELGFALGPLVSVAAIGALSLSGLPWLMTFGLLVSLILYLRFRDAPAPALTTGRSLPFGQALVNMSPIMLPVVAIIFLSGFVSANAGTYLPTFLTGEGSNLFMAGAAFSITEIAGTVSVFLSGPISDRFGRRVVLVFSAVATPLFVLLFLLADGWLRIPALMGIGFASFCANPVFLAMVQEHYAANRALASSLYMAISFVVRAIVVVIVGALGDRFGLRPVFFASAGLYLLVLPFVFLLPRR